MPFTIRPVREEKKPFWRRSRFIILTLGLAESVIAMMWKAHRHAAQQAAKAKRLAMLKRTLVIVLSALFVLLLAVGTLRLLVRLKVLSLGGMLSGVGTEVPVDAHGFTNVLLLGVGDNDHDGIDLTDTIIVASLDPTHTRTSVLLSLPRDLYVLKPAKMREGRVNSLYRDYKGYLMSKGETKAEASIHALNELGTEIGSVVGLEIHGVVKLNFSGFEQAIDALGGIDVVVPEDIVDTEYPGPNYSYQTFSITQGLQHLDGATALKYVRSRHTTSDFSRSARQQQVIEAAVNRAKAGGILRSAGTLTELMSIAEKNMESTFSARELIGLAGLGTALDQSKVVSMQLNDQNGLFSSLAAPGGFLYAPPREQFEGAAVLLPVSMPEFPVSWKQLQAFGTLLFLNRELFVRPPRIVILNAGAKEGSARKLGAELTRYGFNVLKTHNLKKQNNPTLERSSIALNPSPASPPEGQVDPLHAARTQATAMTLSTLLSFDRPKAVDLEAFTDGADIALILGKDFQYAPLQDTLLQ